MDSGFDLNTRMCKRCRARVETKTMKYDLNGKDLICTSCYEKQRGIRVAPKRDEPLAERKPQGAAAAVHKAISDEKKTAGTPDRYICGNCKYKFRATMRNNLRCPYCGSADVTVYKPMMADDLLNDSLDKRYDN